MRDPMSNIAPSTPTGQGGASKQMPTSRSSHPTRDLYRTDKRNIIWNISVVEALPLSAVGTQWAVVCVSSVNQTRCSHTSYIYIDTQSLSLASLCSMKALFCINQGECNTFDTHYAYFQSALRRNRNIFIALNSKYIR